MSAPLIQPGALITKDPQASKPYQFDWTDYLTDLVDTISSSSFTITGPDALLTKDNESVITGNMKTQLRLIGGTVGYTYTVTNHITTNGSPSVIDDRSVLVLIENR